MRGEEGGQESGGGVLTASVIFSPCQRGRVSRIQKQGEDIDCAFLFYFCFCLYFSLRDVIEFEVCRDLVGFRLNIRHWS